MRQVPLYISLPILYINANEWKCAKLVSKVIGNVNVEYILNRCCCLYFEFTFMSKEFQDLEDYTIFFRS